MATLSTRDQKEMDTLNDDIRELKQENKKAFAERMRLEAQVNKLENLLTNNLNRRKVGKQRLRLGHTVVCRPCAQTVTYYPIS